MKKGQGKRPTTISHHLAWCFVASTLIPTILITIVLCVQFGKNYNEIAQSQMRVSENLINNIIDDYCAEINILATAPYYHSYFSSRDVMDPADPDYAQRVNAFQSEIRTLLNFANASRSDLADYLIWSEGDYLYTRITTGGWYLHPDMARTQPCFIRAQESEGTLVFSPLYAEREWAEDPEQLIDAGSFYVSRKIRNLRQPEQNSIVLMRIDARGFDEKLSGISLLYDSFVVVTNERDELIYSSKPLTGGSFYSILGSGSFSYDGSTWRTISSSLHNYPLTIRTVYSIDDLYSRTQSIILTVILAYSLGLVLAFLLYFRFSRWITLSTTAIQSVFTQMENGILTVSCPPLKVDEFNALGESLNKMIAQLNEHIKNEYLMTIQQKSFQLHTLQSQIQPHFLINTIYCFIALNQLGEKEKLNSGFYELSRLLRYVLSKKRYTTLGDEIDFLTDYLKLHLLRFGDRLTFTIDCPEEYRGMVIPRLLLQPLVENAVIHGIEPCEHPCLCRIRVQEKEGQLSILVEDNGVGFDSEVIAQKAEQNSASLSQDIAKDDKPSVGLYYVKERLKMWSEKAALHISCEETTRAEIVIPLEVIEYESADR